VGNPAVRTASGALQPGIAELLAAGLAHHQAGRLAEAEVHYRRILDSVPDHADVLHLLGGLAYQTGRHPAAIELIGRAIGHNGGDPSYHCSYGLVLQGLDRLDEAIASYDRALLLSPDYAAALINRGLALEALERFAEALESYDRALAIEPNFAEAWLNRGNTLQQLGRFGEALESYDHAIAVRPDLAEAHYNRAEALHSLVRLDEERLLSLQHLDEAVAQRDRALAQERLEEALASYDRVLTLRSDYPGISMRRGITLQKLGRLTEALDSYDRALALRPDDAEIWIGRGGTLQGLGRLAEALESYGRALALKPNSAAAVIDRGYILQQLGRFAEALNSYDQALTTWPDFAEAWLNRGNALEQLGRFVEALESYDRALAVRPDFLGALLNRGSSLEELGRYAEALESYNRALAVRPDYASALNNRGNALQQLGRFGEALDSYNRALAANPHYSEAMFNRGNLVQKLGNVAEALEGYDQPLDDAVRLHNRGFALPSQEQPNGAIVSNQAEAIEPAYAIGQWFNTKQRLWDWDNYDEGEAKARDSLRTSVSRLAPFALLALSSTPEEQLECSRHVTAAVAVRAPLMLARAKPRPTEKIRLGYLSHDFRENAVAILISGLIEQHDRQRFEIVGYSYGPDDHSGYRARLERAFDRFVDIRDMEDQEAAELIHSDAVDILIDLNGYTGESRAEILACRPAPIQVNYLGFTATMAADFIDYIIADRFVVPEDQQPFFSERLVHLPECYQCNDDKREIAERTPSRAECELPEAGFVFCCFSNSYKITPIFFDIWMRLLHAVPGSVLWLLDPWTRSAGALAKANLARAAAARGIEPERLVFAPRLRFYPDHLARHRLADLFLDTLPFNAHTTASDALWAGLPLLTCAGNTFAGRVAGSMLHAVGLGELVTTSLEEYEALALRLARDVELLRGLRERLAHNRLSYPLFDTRRYARNLEAAYRRMWETSTAGRAPAAFSVS
jgi:predicted O-linked N-acetylglucosamine transferase (SPINDLY family)